VEQKEITKKHEAEHAATSFVMQRWAWLGRLMQGKRDSGDITIDGFSASFDGVRWLAVVRGFDAQTFRFYVCFGSDERLYYALRNVTSSVAQGKWRTDKFRKVRP